MFHMGCPVARCFDTSMCLMLPHCQKKLCCLIARGNCIIIFRGNKWAATKWVYSDPQMWSHPCQVDKPHNYPPFENHLTSYWSMKMASKDMLNITLFNLSIVHCENQSHAVAIKRPSPGWRGDTGSQHWRFCINFWRAAELKQRPIKSWNTETQFSLYQ